MENRTFELDHILYLENTKENTISIIGNTLDSANSETRNASDLLDIQRSYMLIKQLEEQNNKKSKPNIFSRFFSLFGNKNDDDNQQQIKCNSLDDNLQIENTTLHLQKQRLSWFQVGQSVNKICEDSFYFCKQIREITFTDLSKLQTIEKNAFSYSSLTYLQIPENVTLQKGWCSDTPNLTSVKIISNNPRYLSINDRIIFGKSEIEKDEYDILVFCSRSMKDVDIPNYIEIIDPNAFEYCKMLQQVSFSSQSKLRIIDDYAFFLSSIQKIIIPSSVTQLGKSCFSECKSLSNVSFSDQSKLELINEYAFSNSSIVRIEIPSSVVHICKYAFYLCKNLREVHFSNNPKLQIDVGAFSYSSINDISIPLCVTQIQEEVFSNCKKLQQISIPSSITKIGVNAFANSHNLQNVSFQENSMLQIIDDGAFSYSSISDISIPLSVTEIQKEVFSNCEKLQQISIPSSITKIGVNAFANCRNLQNVSFPENSMLQIIDDSAFCYASIKKLSIPSGVVELREGWCRGTTNLTDIEVYSTKKQNIVYYNDSFIIGKSDIKSDIYDILYLARRDIKIAKIPPFIKVISSFAFYECTKLKKVIFQNEANIQSIGKYAFFGCALREIKIPRHLKEITEHCFAFCNHLRIVEFSTDSELELIDQYCFYHASFESIYIPTGVKQISIGSFNMCKKLKFVHFQSNSELEIIGEYAFNGTSIYSIVIPSNVVEVEDHAFEFCRNLQIIEISQNSKLMKRKAFNISPLDIIMTPVKLNSFFDINK